MCKRLVVYLLLLALESISLNKFWYAYVTVLMTDGKNYIISPTECTMQAPIRDSIEENCSFNNEKY